MDYENLSEEQERAQGHPIPWSEIFDHADPPVFDEAGPSYYPGERSSAARHAKAVRSREQAIAERRDLAVIARAADEQNDDRALDRATELIRQGQPVPAAVRIRAARAAQRNGGAIPSAELHAAKALRGRQAPDNGDDNDRRRDGHRPRS
jgi:hypothetical protein